VSANVVGSAGTTKVSGSELQSALGLYSTWMSFSRGGSGAPAGGSPTGGT
jgi:peptidoglycan hydrolase-like amidase